jgi:hypothetical protein
VGLDYENPLTWFISTPRISACRALFLGITIINFSHAFFCFLIMPIQDQESRIILAIEAIRSSKKLSRRAAAKLYNVPETSLRDRINGIGPRREYRPVAHNLDELEEEVLCKYILELDHRGFSPGLHGVEDMANLILNSRGGERVGKLWAHRFVKRRQELKTRQTRAYDFQRALCENPEVIGT